MLTQYTAKPEELLKKFAPYNPRRISAYELERLKASISQFGFVVPVVINTRTGKLVSGHQRIKAAVELNIAEVPVVEIDVAENDEKVLNLAMNRIHGHFDAEKLDKIFRHLASQGADTELTGFDAVGVMEIREIVGHDIKKEAEFEQFVFRVKKADVPKVREALTAAKAEKEKMEEERKENGNSNACALAIVAAAVRLDTQKKQNVGSA